MDGLNHELVDYKNSSAGHFNIQHIFKHLAESTCSIQHISKHLVEVTCNSASLEAEFWNSVGSVPVGGNSCLGG